MSKNRIILKLSGEFFKSTDNCVDIDKTFALAREIVKISKHYQLGVVFGGGNIFRGRQMNGKKIKNPADWHFVGMASTFVNALALQAAFRQLNIPVRIISAFDPLAKNNHYFSRGEIVVFAFGTGKPFVTTDTTAVVRAIEIKAGLIIKATKVDGVYSDDPEKNSQAKKFDRISYADYLKIRNTTIFDKNAVALAAKKKIPIYIFKWGRGVLKKAIELRANGTLINSS